jgi:hypothetical protein
MRRLARGSIMTKINKLTAPIGTVALVAWPDVTAWCLCGWRLLGSRGNAAELRRA